MAAARLARAPAAALRASRPAAALRAARPTPLLRHSLAAPQRGALRTVSAAAAAAAACVASAPVRASDAAAQQPRRRAGTLAEGPVEVDKLIAAHKVVVFSKTYCPYCCAVKELLDSLGVQYALVELDTRDDGPLLQQRMAAISKVQTVPNVFLGGEFLADSSGTRRLFKEGKLQELLRQHGVAFSEPASA